MAISKYDIFLMLRAQDRASSTLRRVSGDLRGLAGATGTADAAALQLQRRWEAVGRAGTILRDTGRTARLFGIAAGGAVAFAAYQFAKLDSASSLAASQMGKVGISFEQSRKNAVNMRNAVVQTMRDSTSSTEDLTGAAYDLFSSLNSTGKAFLTFSDGARLLKLGSDAAIAGGTDTRTATQALISVMNDFNIPAKRAKDTLQLLFSGVRYGRMTFQDFAGTLGQTSAAAAASGQSLQTMVGTMAFLTRRLPVRQAAVGFARLTEIFARPQMLAGLKKLGVSITDTNGHLLQMPQIIQRLVHAFPELTRGGVILQNFFKLVGGQTATIQARRAFTFLARQWRDYNTILGATTGNTTQFTKQLNLMNQSLGVRWAKFINRLKADMLDLGQRAIPALTKLAAPVERLVKAFEDLSPHTKNLIVTWTAYGAAIAVVGGSIAALVGGLLNLVAIFGKWGRLTSLNIVVLASIAAALLKGKDAFQSLGAAAHYATDAVTHFFDFAGSGWKQFLVSIAAAGLVGRRLFGGTRGGGASGAGGIFNALIPFALLPKLKEFVTNYKASFRELAGLRVARNILNPRVNVGLIRNTEAAAVSAGRFSRYMQLAGYSVLALPGPLKVAAVALAGVGFASYLVNKHMDSVRKHTAEFNKQLQVALGYVVKIKEHIQEFTKLPDITVAIKTDRASLNETNRQIRDMLGHGARMTNPALQALYAQRATERRQLRTDLQAFSNVGRTFSRDIFGTAGLDKIRAKLADARQRQKYWYDMLAKHAQLYSQIPAFGKRADAEIQKANDDTKKWTIALEEAKKALPSPAVIRRALSGYIQSLQDMGLLPDKIPPRVRAAMIQAMIDSKRILNAANLRAIIYTELDPVTLQASIRNLQKVIAAAAIPEAIMKGGLFNPFAGFIDPKKLAAADRARAKLKELQKEQKQSASIQKQLSSIILGENKALEDLLKSTSDNTKATKKHSQAAADAANAYQKASQAYNDMLQKLKTATQTLSSTFDQFAQQNKSAFGDFITGGQYFQSGIGSILMGVQQQIMAFSPNWKTIFSPKMIVDAANQQLKAFERWRKDLTRLARGLPKDLVQALAAEGPQAAPILEAIMQMSPAQRHKIISDWKRGQKDIQSATKADMQRQLRIWKSLGKGIVANILAGMSEESAKMDKWLKDRALALLKWLGQFDPNIEKAYERARAQYAKTHKGRTPATTRAERAAATGGTRRTQSVSGGTTVHMTVNAHHTETLDQTMRRVDFRFRNRAAYLPAH